MTRTADIARVLLLQKYVAPYRVPLFRAIAQSGRVDLTVLCYGSPERRRRFDTTAEHGFRQVQCPGVSIRAGYERNLDVPYGLPGAIARHAADVVVCAPDWGGIAASGARNPARLLIWSEATAVTEAGVAAPKRALRRRLYRRASGFLVPGRLARDYLESMGCVGPFVAMPNTIDESRFWLNDAGIAAKFAVKMPRLITFSGSLIERKGVDVLLLAFAAACAREPAAAATTRLRIIGAGPLQQPHQAMPNVEFTGHLDGDAYRCAMQQSQVFVLPSRSDCNPLVVVEALNCGTALILSDGVGSHPEALQTNGALVPRGDVRALTDALAWMMTCPTGELHAMAQRSRGIAAAFGTATAREQFVAGVVASLRADVPMEER